MLLVELLVVAVGVAAVGYTVRERGRTRAALTVAVDADRRYRTWSGERARAMAARNTISDVAQASGEAARKVQRGSSAVAGALGAIGGRLADSVRRLATTTPEIGRSSVVRGEVVASRVEKDDWFLLMLEAAEAEDAARARRTTEAADADAATEVVPPVVAVGPVLEDPTLVVEPSPEDVDDEEQPAGPAYDAVHEPAPVDEPTAPMPRPDLSGPDDDWLSDVPRDDVPRDDVPRD